MNKLSVLSPQPSSYCFYFMNYNETLEFLYSQLPAWHRIGKAAYKSDLHNTLLLDEYLNHPHRNYQTIHIAGTNGKGSVSHMIASVLQEAGYRTGLYTSPHLKDFRERIRINGEMIAESEVVDFVAGNMSFIKSVNPSFFEMSVAMALSFFSKEKVDIAVIEVGLGGRLDSTNIIKPLLSVITNIGHDHMDLLGDTLAKVAFEKAGIIKADTPVIISESDSATRQVFVSKAAGSNSTLEFAEEHFSCDLEADYDPHRERRFRIRDLARDSVFEGFTPLGGNYQAKNIQAVFSVFRVLKGRINVSDIVVSEGIRKVVKNTGLMGRWQVLDRNPLIVCDTGHNREGLEYVMAQISGISYTHLHIVLGFVNDKDLGSVLPLFPKDATYYFTKAAVPRALNEEDLKTQAGEYGLRGKCYADVKSALSAARSSAVETDLIFIGGSTFVVAEVI